MGLEGLHGDLYPSSHKGMVTRVDVDAKDLDEDPIEDQLRGETSLVQEMTGPFCSIIVRTCRMTCFQAAILSFCILGWIRILVVRLG